MQNNRKMTPPPPPPAKTNSSNAEELASEFDDLHFFPSRSSPPTMKNFTSFAGSLTSKESVNSSISSSTSSSSIHMNGSNSNSESNVTGFSDDFTIGSRNNNSTNNLNLKKDHHHHHSETHKHDTKRRSSHPSNNYSSTYNKSSSKERYVFSNFRFLVKEGSAVPRSVDESFDWLSIEMVLVPEIEHLLCPICLDVPCVPRFTRCGHIYCLPCLLQFFQTSEPSIESLGKNWRSCPVCAEALHLKQLRPVKFCPATEPKEGDIFHSVLVKKSVGSFQPLEPAFPNDTLNNLSPFQRLIPVSRSFVLNQILNPELVFLRSEVKTRRARGEDSLELSFYEAAIKHIEERKEGLNSDAISRECSNGPNSNNSAEFYHFHQSRDGLNIFLHPLCMKILKNHFESYEAIPSHLSLPILQLEREIVTHGNRKRFKYLDHLSLGTQIILVEVDLRSIVSSSTLTTYSKELASRQGVRDQRLASDSRESSKQADRSILEEWKMMEDDYYSISQATAAMDIRVPESVKLDNLDDEASFPLPSSFNNNAGNTMRPATVKKSPAFTNTSSSPSFSALAHSLNSPFTYNQSYGAWNSSPPEQQPHQPVEDSPNLSTKSTSSTGKKKIVLFSNGLGNTKK